MYVPRPADGSSTSPELSVTEVEAKALRAGAAQSKK